MDAVIEVKDALADLQGRVLDRLKKVEGKLDTADADLTALSKQMADELVARQRPNTGEGRAQQTAAPKFYDTKTKRLVPVLAHKSSLAALDVDRPRDALPSMGRVLRGIVLGGHADDAAELAEERKSLAINNDPDGGYTVSSALSSTWIDLLRANMVLSKAGAVTVPMETSHLALASLTADPTISWHGENAAITASDPSFGAVNLRAKTVVCVVKMSLELAQDSANIEEILQRSLTSALACGIDQAGISGNTTDAAAAPSGIVNLSGRNSVTSIGAPTDWGYVHSGMYELLLDNVAMESIGALVAHPAVWRKMAALKSGISGDKTALTMPAEIAAIPKLWTTAAPLTGGTTATGVIGDWRDLLFGVRKQISVKVLSEAFMASNLQVAIVAYARCDFATARAASFCTLEGITV